MQARKELSIFLVLILFTALLTGCSDISTIFLQEDGSGSYEEVMTLSTDTCHLLLGDDLTDDQLKEQYKTLYPGAEVSIEEHLDTGVAEKEIRIKIDFANKSEFQNLLNPYGIVSVKYTDNYYSRSLLSSPEDSEENNDTAGSFTETFESILDDNQELWDVLSKELQNIEIKTTITFPYPVIESNGIIQDDGKTVIWDFDQLKEDSVSSQDSRVYALFHEQTAQQAPKIRGAKDGKYYNTGITLYVDSSNLLERITVNGQDFATDYLLISQEGIYDITAIDKNNNLTSIHFGIDTTKPTIKGVAQNRIYRKARTIKFSDKGSGIKKAILNGKKITSGKKVEKKGTYILKIADRAGNQKTINFELI